MEDLNPPIIVKKINYEGKNFHVIRDDYLPGGTKQRALDIFLKDNIKEYIYAGPAEGYAQIALSYIAYIRGVKSTIFLRKRNKGEGDTELTKRARKYGAKIVYIRPPNRLRDIQRRAKEYENKKKDRYLLPFGLYNEDFIHTLSYRIKEAWGRKRKPKRLWLVAGSSTILKSLSFVFPDCKFLVVQVGKKIWPDQLEGFKSKLYISDKSFIQEANPLPPYPSVKNYDAKLWEFVQKYGKDGDYIWNVGRD